MHGGVRAAAAPPGPQVKFLLQFGPIRSAAQSYKAAVNTRLAHYGLRYDDLYDPLKDEVRHAARHAALAHWGPGGVPGTGWRA